MHNKIIRSYDFEIRAENNEKHGDYIVGRPIIYGSKANLGYFDEIIERGALDNTNLKDVAFLVNHNNSMIPLARSRNNNENSTMQITVDDKGMLIRVNLDTENNTEARSLYSAIKRGDITGMSFAFYIEKDGDEWEDLRSEHPTRHIRSISSVTEVSAVTRPAYQSTVISARDKEALESAKNTLEGVRSQSLESEKKRLELELVKRSYKKFFKQEV